MGLRFQFIGRGIIFNRLNTNKLSLALTLLAACVLSAPAVAQEPRLEWNAAGRSAPMLTLGLKPADALFPIALSQSRTPSLPDRLSFTEWVGSWRHDVAGRLAARHHVSGNDTTTVRSDSTAFLPPPPIQLSKAAVDTTGDGPGILSGTFGQYADIGMMIRGRGEMGGAWNRYTPCDPGLQQTCKAGLMPVLRPDIQFGVVVGGTISDRVHVNVDYDQTREFDAANNINVYYQGLDDEILQRLEVGDVSIRLPSSRYLTQGIPSGNFGFKATGQLGPLDFQTVWAQQRGDVSTREFRLGGTGNKQGLEQDEALEIDDADYVKGQFFFVLDPDSIEGAPHIDVLALRGFEARSSQRPQSSSLISVYRDERPSINNAQQQSQLGYFLADGVMPDGSRTHRGLFKRLEQGKDYFVHNSGLWIMLRSPLRSDEALAIAYVSDGGETIGTLNAESAPVGTVPSLRLVRGPLAMHQPNFSTWDYEMHNVYRIHSSGTVQTSSIQMSVSLGQASAGRTSTTTLAGQLPYLRLFGLDEDAPTDALDLAQVFQPAQSLGSSSTTSAQITGTYVILPTLRPFFEPAPVGSVRLSASEAKLALGNDANSLIYNDEDPVEREASARFRLNFKYRVTVEGLVSSFNLGAFGLREESERIAIGGRTLTRGTDYNIDYDLGMVTLMDPQSLFATNPGAEIRATWEQRSMFQIAPTSVFGLNAQYKLGTRGDLNFVGLYQSEKTIMSRPQLGVEPGSIFLGGTSARFDFGGALLDRALSMIPGLRISGVSSVIMNGEAALSAPNPNTRNEAYVDDFESADATNLSLFRRNWQLGSRPQNLAGGQGYFPDALNPENAAQLVWQHDILQNGVPIGSETPALIDKDIKVAGNQVPETVMWLSLGDSAKAAQGRRWRSMTTVLSTTGIDMTRSEYLELYVKTGEVDTQGKALIIDIGSVSEDAFYFDAEGRTTGRYDDGMQWGLNELDAEARLALREIWGPDKDERGLWNQPCVGTGNTAPALGDPNGNCARKNGYLDTEDLDGNGILEQNDGSYFRYTIPLDKITPYLVRDYDQTGTFYQLYRIPLRSGTAVGATQASWRFVKHLRMTVTSATARPVDQIVIARMKIVGSRWVKRDIDGVNRGLLSAEKGLSAGSSTVQASPVSKLTNGDEYSPPPSVSDELQDPTQGFGANGGEFNEKGLSIKYSSLGADERAEVYFRYPQQPRSFLTYRQMKLWAVAKTGNWGATGNERLLVKVGQDPRNYYFYQTKLNPAVGAGTAVSTEDWRPEIVIDFEQWFDLKARAEVELLQGAQSSANQPLVLFSEDSTYGIVLEDRSRAPNLAAVREMSFAVYNGGTGSATGEVWLNDMRLTNAFRDAGVAGNVSFNVQGGDFLQASMTYANQGALFRQLNQEASYLSAGDFSLQTSAQLGLLLPAGWNIDMPVTLMHTNAGQAPTLLSASDVRARDLPGLRETGSSTTRVGVSLRKRALSSNPIISAIVDPLTLRIGYNAGNSSAITARDEANGLDGSLSYSRDIKPLDLDIIPGFLEAAMRILAPAAIERSPFFQRVSGARFRFTPARFSFSTTYFGQERRSYQFNSILKSDSDNVVVPIESPRKSLDADATINLQPFNSLTADISLRTTRDLLPARRATTRELEQGALEEARSGVAGLDLGWETNRSIVTGFNFKPEVSSWLKPRMAVTTRFGTDRSPSYLELITLGADTTAILQRRFQADRQLQRQIEIDPYLLFRAFSKDSTGLPHKAMKMMQRINLAWNSALGSQFDRESINPGVGYQLALGDLEAMRILGIDSASAATETGRFEASTSVRLMRTTSIDVQYLDGEVQAFDQRGRTRLENETTWPNIRLNWNEVPLPGLIRKIMPQLQMNASYVLKRRTEALGSLGSSDRGAEEVSLPFSARFLFAGGITASYAGTWSDGQSDDPTGDAESGGMNHNVNVTLAIKPPESMKGKLKQPLRASLGLTQNSQEQCRFRTIVVEEDTEESCIPFINFRNRTVNLTLDTVLSDLIVGMQLGYTSRQDFIGLRRGNSQFQLGIFANFDLPVGKLPVGMGSGMR